MKNWLSKAFLLLLLLLVAAGLGYSFYPTPVYVDIAPVQRDSLIVTVDEDGKTRIREKYVVSTPLSGRLLRIDLDPGDTVTANKTLLAVIKPRDPELLDARSIAQAEARVRTAQASLSKAEPLLEKARLRQSQAERDQLRERKLLVSGGSTEERFENAQMRNRSASEEVRASRYARDIAGFELQQAQAALLRSHPPSEGDSPGGPNGWNYEVRSPIKGRVLRVFQESAAVVTSGTPLLELGDPTDLEVEIDVLSSDAVKVRTGARVLLEHWGGERTLEGVVRLVEPAGFTKISTLGVEEQRVNVIVDLTDPPSDREELGDGFRVEARIVTASVEDALCVPTSSLFRYGDNWYVYRVTNGVVRRTGVEIGSQNGLLAEVTSGLSEGDPVVLHPSDQVRDNTAVAPRSGSE